LNKESIIVKPKSSNIVRKAEALLRARYSLSKLAIKLITVIISMLSKNDADFKIYILKVADFKELTGTESNKIYDDLRNTADELLTKKIEFDDKKVGFMLTRWIASAEYSIGSGEIEIEISQKLKPLLLQLKEGNYLNYELKNILALKSTYIIRLYERLKHEYNKIVKYKGHTVATYEIYIEDLREEFKIPSSYQYSSHIKKRIFEKAIIEFKENTDIEIAYRESLKRSKKVIAVEFTIRENTTNLIEYLKNVKTFITYMRKNFINKDIMESQGMILSISKDGRIYDKKTLKEYNKDEALQVWNIWYGLAMEDKLKIMK